MQRIPEPDLMNDEAQVRAYAEADFEAPHEQLLQLFGDYYPAPDRSGTVLDLGCGASASASPKNTDMPRLMPLMVPK